MFHQAVSENLRAFVSDQFQAAVSQKLDQSGSDFRPGNQDTLTVGLRYENSMAVVPQIQFNLTTSAPTRVPWPTPPIPLEPWVI